MTDARWGETGIRRMEEALRELCGQGRRKDAYKLLRKLAERVQPFGFEVEVRDKGKPRVALVKFSVSGLLL